MTSKISWRRYNLTKNWTRFQLLFQDFNQRLIIATLKDRFLWNTSHWVFLSFKSNVWNNRATCVIYFQASRKRNISRISSIHEAQTVKTRCVRILSKLRNGTFSRKRHPLTHLRAWDYFGIGKDTLWNNFCLGTKWKILSWKPVIFSFYHKKKQSV